ncbi:O-antigen ligase family protein [Cryobacterium sp.]|jgi:exopolysaccharide production protein ExoQ|uniref:O-antigen ligase family protein n=1 Tax=Cryobacterium sp. TaxID=1926290 RepID=UPI002612C4E6|nr:O-antigen ligase family protein [Cryobacterium sp.]MCU1444908.1 exopolysaccharide production protein [Cryobacterium sp.]
MPVVQSRLPVRLFATLVFFTVLAGQFWRNLLGWWGFGAIAVIIVVASAWFLVSTKPAWAWRTFPKSLVGFMLLATVSIAWSAYPSVSALGITLQWITTITALFIALCLSWTELLRTLAVALRVVLALSLLFEAFIAVFIGHAVLPFWVEYSGKIPAAFYWSRSLLLEGGPVEGIVASRNLLGFIALLALIVFAVQLAAGTVARGRGIFWVVLALVMLWLTRSATVSVALLAVVVALVFALWARRVPPLGRRGLYLTAAALVAAVVVGVVAFSSTLLGLLGKSDDLTGRFDIWNRVIELAGQRPVAGWGWVSYWAPWVEPFDGLAVRKGVQYLQAHNAWLDVWLQLGVLGLIVFGALAVSTLWRSWFLAVDRPRLGIADTAPYSMTALLPLLLIVALLAQSLAESRILVESGWVLLLVLAVKTKRPSAAEELLGVGRR